MQNQKETYDIPELEVIRVEENDIIRTSPDPDEGEWDVG